MEQLVSASIGLYVDKNETYYLQVIVAGNESQWLLPISRDNALSISITESIEIVDLP